MQELESKAAAVFKGVATGDAIGKQTETLTRASVLQSYPAGVRGFEGTPGAVIPRYAGNRKREWRIGETTDDTERTMAVARAILADRVVQHESVARELLRCTKCVHPGIRSLWEFHQAGDPARVADGHDGCGAAIRVSPVGILYRSARLDEIIAAATEASIPTHGGALAIAAAAATAAAVSAAIEGAGAGDIVALAERAATEAEGRRSGSGDGRMARALRGIYEDLRRRQDISAADVAATYFPRDPTTIVPLAIALAAVLDSARDAILLAANVGGDSDSVASIAGGILGARRPDTIDDEWFAIVEQVNHHDLVSIAERLAALRG